MSTMLLCDWKTEATGIPKRCIGDICIEKKKVDAGTMWTMREEERGIFGYDEVLFTCPATVTGLEEKGKVWMTDSPREYYAMWELNARTKPKKVLVGGLGLGIISNLLAKRRDIDEIVVAEKSKEVINLVKNHVDPRVKVVNEDVFNTVHKMERENRCPDTIILDIYKGTENVDDVELDVESVRETCPSSKVLPWKFMLDLENKEAFEYQLEQRAKDRATFHKIWMGEK